MTKGTQVIEVLAERFPQLYVAPAEGAQDAHRLASGRGVAPQERSLDHFVRSDEDELREVETPAGTVEVVFLKERQDFETFLQTIGHRSMPDPIARTVGAITYRGLADWERLHRRTWITCPGAARTGLRSSGGWPRSRVRFAARLS